MAARISKAEAREAKAKAAGHTKLADAHRQAHHPGADAREQADARLAKAEAKCARRSGATGSTGSGGTTTTGA